MPCSVACEGVLSGDAAAHGSVNCVCCATRRSWKSTVTALYPSAARTPATKEVKAQGASQHARPMGHACEQRNKAARRLRASVRHNLAYYLSLGAAGAAGVLALLVSGQLSWDDLIPLAMLLSNTYGAPSPRSECSSWSLSMLTLASTVLRLVGCAAFRTVATPWPCCMPT